MAHRGPRDRGATEARPVLSASRDLRGSRGRQARWACAETLAHAGRGACPGTRCRGHRVCPVLRGHRGRWAQWALPARTARLDPPVRVGRRARPANRALRGSPGCQDRKGRQGRWGRTARTACRGPPEPWDRTAFRAFLDRRAWWAHPGCQANPDLRASMACRALRGLRVWAGHQAPTGLAACLARTVPLARQGRTAFREARGRLVRRVPPARPVRMGKGTATTIDLQADAVDGAFHQQGRARKWIDGSAGRQAGYRHAPTTVRPLMPLCYTVCIYIFLP